MSPNSRAKLCPFAVPVEGVTDVWSVGPCATALLGKTISFAQSRLITFTLRNRPLVVVLDAGARTENAHIVEALRRDHPAAVVLVDLPDGTDPGSLTREANLALIHTAAKAQDVCLESPPDAPLRVASPAWFAFRVQAGANTRTGDVVPQFRVKRVGRLDDLFGDDRGLTVR